MNKNFTLLQDRNLPFSPEPLLVASCCPTMDLVALASKNHLVVQRSIKWEKLFSVQSVVTCMAWRPDGKALCVGHEDGSLSLYDVESGEEIPLPYSARPHSTFILCMYWTSSKTRHSERLTKKQKDPFADEMIGALDPLAPPYMDRASNCLINPPPISKDAATGDYSQVERDSINGATTMMGSHLFGIGSQYRDRPSLEVLVSGDQAGVVTLSAFGYFPVGCMDLSGAFGSEQTKLEETARALPQVTKVCLSADLNSLVAVLRFDQIGSVGDIKSSSYRVVTVDTRLLHDRAFELHHVAALCGHIGEHISTVQLAVQAMSKQWIEGLTPLKTHLEPLLHQLRCFERPNTAEQEFFMMLTCGVTSSALQQYISGVTEQTFQRLGRTLDVACAMVENLATNHLIRAAEALVFRLTDMMGLAQWEERFEDIGLELEYVEGLKRAAELLLLKGQETLVWVQDARANFAAYTVWLQGIVRKQSLDEDSRAHDGEDQVKRRQQEQKLKPVPAPDIDRLIHLLGPCTSSFGEPGLISPMTAQENSQLLHHHVTEQFQNAPLSTHTRKWSVMGGSKLNAGYKSNMKYSWQNITDDPRLPAFDILSLQQIVGLLRDRWKDAFHKPSECVSTAFTPVHNIPLFKFSCSRNSDAAEIGVSERTMAIHFRTTKWNQEGDTDADGLNSFNVLIAFVLNIPELKNLGLESENVCPTLWILRYSTTSSDGEWSVASVELDNSFYVHDIDFYGEAPGGENMDSDGKSPCVIISSSRTEDGQKTSRTISTIDYSEMTFTSLKNSQFFSKSGQKAAINGVESLIQSIITDPLFRSSTNGSSFQDVVRKTRALHPTGWTSSGLAVSGTRGVACVFTSNNRFQLFDMEDDEEDEDEDEDDDDE